MLFGAKPFGENMSQEKILRDNIIVNAYKVSFPQSPQISNECKEFIAKCLTYNPAERWAVDSALESASLKRCYAFT